MRDADRLRSQLNLWIAHSEPATDSAIDALIKASPISLPAGYIALLRISDGGETFIGEPDSDEELYLDLWPSADVLNFDVEYEVPDLAPSHFAFGTNGGGELFVLGRRRGDDAVVMLPSIGLSDDAGMLVATSFDEFLSMLEANGG